MATADECQQIRSLTAEVRRLREIVRRGTDGDCACELMGEFEGAGSEGSRGDGTLKCPYCRGTADMEWRVTHNVRARVNSSTRWALVSRATGYGSALSIAMCRRQGLDPHEVLEPPVTDIIHPSDLYVYDENDVRRR